MKTGRVQARSGGYVELPVVPGAKHDIAVDEPFGQRTGPMSASVLDGVKGASDIEKGDLLTVHDDAGGLPGRKFLRTNGFHLGILGAGGGFTRISGLLPPAAPVQEPPNSTDRIEMDPRSNPVIGKVTGSSPAAPAA